MPAPSRPSLVLVTGPEDLLVDRAVDSVVAGLRRQQPGAEVQQVQAATLEPGAVSVLTSPSLFAEVRALVVRGVHEAPRDVLDDLAAYVGDPAPDVMLVLTHSGGVKGKAVLEAARKAKADEIVCPKVTKPGERVAFVRKEFSVRRRAISEPAAKALIDAVGNDLREIANACGQLLSDTDGNVDEAVVARYYRGRAEVSSFQVADAAVEGRTVDALQQLRWALSAGDTRTPLGVTSAMAQALRALAVVAAAPRGARPADLAQQLGMPPWKVDRVRRQMRGWSPESLASAIRAVAEADEQVKTGADKAYAVERAVVAVARARSGRP